MKILFILDNILLSLMILFMVYKIYELYRLLKRRKQAKEEWLIETFGKNYKENQNYQKLKKKGLF